MKSLRVNKKWVRDFEKAQTYTEDLEILFDFFKEGESTVEEVEKQFELASAFLEDIEFRNMLSEEGDSLSAVLQITAGAGGTESCDWAYMLMRMYVMYAEKNNFKIKELNLQNGDVAGIKTVTLQIEGDFSFGWLKGENGFTDWCEFLLLTAMRSGTLVLLLFMYTHLLTIRLKLKSILLISKLQRRVQVELVVKM